MSDFLLSLKGVSLAFGGPAVLDRVSLSVTKGMRAALTGRNGEGKSTLLQVIAGRLAADAGEIVRAPGLRVAYVAQSVDDAMPGRSGGEIRRARLEEALLSRPDILLLDEPTNHLDCEAIDWLEGMLRRAREMAVMVVTHDRRFLKRVATSVFDLDRGELSGWECDYTTFVRRKVGLLADEAALWERKARKLAREEAWIRRGVKARTTRNEGRVAALMKLREEFAARRQRAGVATMRLDTASPGGERVLKVEDLGFSYDVRPETGDGVAGHDASAVRPLVSHFTADVLRGERIGIIGRNGAGKTTLLGLLTGRLAPTTGSVTVGTNVEMAFLDQLRGELKPELTVGENIASDRDEVVVGGARKHVYSYLADFLFAPERVRTPVKALSGGERARLMLAKLFLKPANLLVMDEPTNDLDIETLELLEEQLLDYRGTLLLVSHDREFLDNVVTSTFVLEGDGTVATYPGGYADYLRQKPKGKAPSVRLAESPASPCAPQPAATAGKRLSYGEQREFASLPGKIDALEKEVASLQGLLADGTLFRSDPVKAKAALERLPLAEAALEAALERWVELGDR